MHRYTLANCVVEAKLVRESGGTNSRKRGKRNGGKLSSGRHSGSEPNVDDLGIRDNLATQKCIGESSDSDENDDDIMPVSSSNRFSGLL